MSATTDTPTGVEAYLAAVRASLTDLPAAERDDLLAEVEASLHDTAEDGGAIGARLGSPEEFAAELRAAAGLHQGPAAAVPRPSLRERLERLLARPRVAALARVARELAPVWWVARAYAAVAGVAVAAGATWSLRYPAVPHVGSAAGGLAAILAAVVVSVVLGLRSRGALSRRWALLVTANLVLVVLAFPAAARLTTRPRPDVVVAFAEPVAPTGLTYDGAPVQNIYPYAANGTLLHDILLYDGAGRPIEIGAGSTDPNRRVLTSRANARIFNSFPIRYFEPGTVHVAHPNAGPAIKTPAILPAP